jgi:hypothetical protein
VRVAFGLASLRRVAAVIATVEEDVVRIELLRSRHVLRGLWVVTLV